MHDAYNDPYEQKKTRHKTRNSFEQWKRTKDYQSWRKKQFKTQRGKCAWCDDKISFHYSKTQVDHAMPIYYDGDNNKDNLVLAHKKCNMEKWVRIDATPNWIKKNEKKDKLLQEQKKQAIEILDEIALETIREFVK